MPIHLSILISLDKITAPYDLLAPFFLLVRPRFNASRIWEKENNGLGGGARSG